MAPTLYEIAASPPCRAVYLLSKAANIPLNLKQVNLFTDEHKTAEFTKMNPQNTVPTLVDEDGFTIWDSHAIMIYLLEKYAKNNPLYPNCMKTRALINQRMYFESGILFPRLRALTIKIFFYNSKDIPQEKLNDIKEGYDWAEAFLGNSKYFAGDQLTIADFSIVSTITSLNFFVPIDASRYPRITAWLKRMESLPYYKEANQVGADQLHEALKIKLRN